MDLGCGAIGGLSGVLNAPYLQLNGELAAAQRGASSRVERPYFKIPLDTIRHNCRRHHRSTKQYKVQMLEDTVSLDATTATRTNSEVCL